MNDVKIDNVILLSKDWNNSGLSVSFIVFFIVIFRFVFDGFDFFLELRENNFCLIMLFFFFKSRMFDFDLFFLLGSLFLIIFFMFFISELFLNNFVV